MRARSRSHGLIVISKGMKLHLIKSKYISLRRIFISSIFLFSLFCVCSCCNSKKESVNEAPVTSFDIEQSIRNTVRQFAYYENLPSADAYLPIRTVIIKDPGISLHLHQAESAKQENLPHLTHYIVTIVNPQNQGYSIPMFSNEISGYWNFELQDKGSALPDCHTTFEKEFLTAMDSLHLNDARKMDCGILFEIMKSVINCKEIDTPINPYFFWEYDEWYDGFKCKSAMRKSLNAILPEIRDQRIFGSVHWDSNSERLFHTYLGNFHRDKKLAISIKVYNVGCK